MRRQFKARIIKTLIACAVSALALTSVLSGCRVNSDPELPPVTINNVFTALPTEEPVSLVTSVPSPTPQEEVPITFTDINFENAVREAIGRNIGSIYPADLAEIKSFTARVSGIVSIREISYFTSLEELDLMGNRIADFTPLASLKNLKYLNIAKNFTVMTGDREKGLDISPAGTLPQLEELDASNNLITDVSALASLKTLKRLDIQTNRLTDLSGLEGCVSLEYLNISNSFRIDADNNEAGISDISALANLTELKTLYMSNGMVPSLEAISGLAKLEYVDATYNALRAFPDLSGMESLTTLIVRANTIFSLSGAEKAPKLTTLDVRDNYIWLINEVIKMPSIETIYLDGNPVLDYTPLDILEAIRNGTYILPMTEDQPVTGEDQPVTGEDQPVTGELPPGTDAEQPQEGEAQVPHNDGGDTAADPLSDTTEAR